MLSWSLASFLSLLFAFAQHTFNLFALFYFELLNSRGLFFFFFPCKQLLFGHEVKFLKAEKKENAIDMHSSHAKNNIYLFISVRCAKLRYTMKMVVKFCSLWNIKVIILLITMVVFFSLFFPYFSQLLSVVSLYVKG